MFPRIIRKADQQAEGQDARPIPVLRANQAAPVTPAKLGIASLISAGCTFHGDMEVDSGIKIDGTLNGNLTVAAGKENAWVILSETGRVNGNIKAKTIAIYGRVLGLVVAEKVVIAPSAVIDGDVCYEAIKVFEGAKINGRLQERPDIEAEIQSQPIDQLARPVEIAMPA